MAQEREHTPPTSCLSCSGRAFTEEDTRQATKWGAGSHVMRHYVCDACSFAMTYYLKKSRGKVG